MHKDKPSFRINIYKKLNRIEDLAADLSRKDKDYIEGKLGLELDSILDSLKEIKESKPKQDIRIFEMVC